MNVREQLQNNYHTIKTIVITAGGGVTGFVGGLLNYWQHFKTNTSFSFIDVAITTVEGATLAFFCTMFWTGIVKKFFKNKDVK
jgi:hypothetical protein